eukprot:TRINITY_DN11771_c0_g1_i10.p2 TRINITY_DN11771_c0_g1~~TRINITY_DN11771_c0_g1_i10.p2  ORF type:complete len:160 (+),score=25.41 TRINITY_DN11771_c0_g1_i10:404-883(+)
MLFGTWWQCFTMYTRFPYNMTNGGWNEQPEPKRGEGAVCDAIGDVASGNRSHPADWTHWQSNLDWLKNRNQSEPFFMYQGMDIVHPPYSTCEKFYNMINESLITVPEWKPIEQLHPCDLQSSMLKGCIPDQDDPNATAAFYSKERPEDRLRNVCQEQPA